MKYDRAGNGNEEGIKAATSSIDKAKQKIYMIKPSMAKAVKQAALDCNMSESKFVRTCIADKFEKLFPQRERLDI